MMLLMVTAAAIDIKSISHLIYPLTAKVVGAQQMISQPTSSIFLCSPLPSGTWRTPGLLSSHLFLCLSWLFKFSYCQTSHSLRMTVAAMLYFVAVFVNCPLFAPVEGATTQMSLFPNTGLTAVSVTWSGQLVPVARLACLLLASGNIKGGRKAVGDKNS